MIGKVFLMTIERDIGTGLLDCKVVLNHVINDEKAVNGKREVKAHIHMGDLPQNIQKEIAAIYKEIELIIENEKGLEIYIITFSKRSNGDIFGRIVTIKNGNKSQFDISDFSKIDKQNLKEVYEKVESVIGTKHNKF